MSEHALFNLTDDDDEMPELPDYNLSESEPEGEDAPDSAEAGDGDEDEKLEDGSSTVMLLIGEILVIPSDNVSRGGYVPPANHPDVQSLAKSILSEGLLHHVGVRPLVEPLMRPPEEIEADRARYKLKNGGSMKPLFKLATYYTHRLVYGFERYVAVRDVLGWHTIPCVSKERTDAEALSACVAENAGRRDPTDYDLAMAFAHMVRMIQPRPSWERVAEITGCRPGRARTLVTIVERCPVPLLEAFRASPTAETRRTLERIAVTIDPDNREREEVRHRAMIDEWAKVTAAAAAPRPAQAQATEPGRIDRPGMRNRSRSADGVKLAHLRDSLNDATEWLDPVHGWQPMTPETKTALDSLLRHAVDPRAHARPIR